MKKKISISIESDLLCQSHKHIENGTFRNTSHLIEYALMTLLKTRKK